MQCDSCGRAHSWLELIGKAFICPLCIRKHREMGLIHRTHMDTFRYVIRKLKPDDYAAFLAITRKQIEDIVDFRKTRIRLPPARELIAE